MSEVSFIRAAPPQSAYASRRTAEAPQDPGREIESRKERASAPVSLPNKTTVKAEQIGKYQYGYTFIDADTAQIVGRYPAEPFVAQKTRVSKTI